MDGRKMITDVVYDSPNLKEIIDNLKKKKYLLETDGIGSGNFIFKDREGIEKAYKKHKSKINILAMGTSLYSDLFFEGSCSLLKGEDFSTNTAEANNSIKRWQMDTKQYLPAEYKEVDEICRTLGQYLDFINRKAQRRIKPPL